MPAIKWEPTYHDARFSRLSDFAALAAVMRPSTPRALFLKPILNARAAARKAKMRAEVKRRRKQNRRA
jgi:hypothetical protein